MKWYVSKKSQRSHGIKSLHAVLLKDRDYESINLQKSNAKLSRSYRGTYERSCGCSIELGGGECQIGKNNNGVVKSCTSPLLSCHMYHRHHPPPSHASSHSQCNYAFRIAIALKKKNEKKRTGKTKKEKKGNIWNIEMVMDKISMLADTATFLVVRTNNEVVESKR